MSVHLETKLRETAGSTKIGQRLVEDFVGRIDGERLLPPAQLRVLRGELRTAFKFVRNEFAHNVRQLPRARGLALVQRLTGLYDWVVELADAMRQRG